MLLNLLPRSHSNNNAGSETTAPLRIGGILFPGFQALDLFGPLDALNVLSQRKSVTLSLIASTLDPVSTEVAQFPTSIGQNVVPTHTFSTAPGLDVLLIPGGWGTRASSPAMDELISFIKDRYPSLKYLITVCTGSRLAAMAGVLDGKRATTNKRAWESTKALGLNVKWVSHARWVADGNCWTSSGVTAGIDVIFAWIEEVYGREVATEVANVIEYERHEDSTWDPFADLYNLPDDRKEGSDAK
jgi:transcriptional regulator GlxA family with amidase domain